MPFALSFYLYFLILVKKFIMYKVKKKYENKGLHGFDFSIPNLSNATEEQLALVYEKHGEKYVTKVKNNAKETKTK